MAQPALRALSDRTPDALDAFETEAEAVERSVQNLLSSALNDLPDAFSGVVVHEGGVILASLQRLVRARQLADGIRS